MSQKSPTLGLLELWHT